MHMQWTQKLAQTWDKTKQLTDYIITVETTHASKPKQLNIMATTYATAKRLQMRYEH